MTNKRPPPAPDPGPALAAAAPATPVADDFTDQQIADHLAASLQLLTSLGAQWPGLVSLVGVEKVGNVGRLVGLLGAPLRELFAALTPVAGEDPARAATKVKLVAVFDAALGDADQGKDPSAFEVDLLARRLDRIEAEQKILAAIDALRATFADDVMNTGAMVIEPGLKALEMARSCRPATPSSTRCSRR